MSRPFHGSGQGCSLGEGYTLFKGPLTPGGTKQNKGLMNNQPPMVSVWAPVGLALGPGLWVLMSNHTCHQRGHPSPLLIPATIHFRAGKSFTILSHSTRSSDPVSTNTASACRMGPGGRHRKWPFLPLGKFKLSHFPPTVQQESSRNQPVLSTLEIADWYSLSSGDHFLN